MMECGIWGGSWLSSGSRSFEALKNNSGSENIPTPSYPSLSPDMEFGETGRQWSFLTRNTETTDGLNSSAAPEESTEYNRLKPFHYLKNSYAERVEENAEQRKPVYPGEPAYISDPAALLGKVDADSPHRYDHEHDETEQQNDPKRKIDKDVEEEEDDNNNNGDGEDDNGEGAKDENASSSNHSDNSSERSEYVCNDCGCDIQSKAYLKRHIALCRGQKNECPMNNCRFQCANPTEMEVHIAKHTNANSVTSGSSKKKCSTAASLQRIRYEREEYHCQACAYTCTTEKAYQKHVRGHSGSRSPSPAVNMSCVVCGKDRPTEADLNKHMRKHIDDRHFCCDICVFRTIQLKKLIQHRRMHTGEKPHLCPHCSYRSARRDNLRSHVRRVHRKDNLFCDTFSPRRVPS